MTTQDLHLAAAAISGPTRAALERLGFSEDLFSDCRYCAPSFYHATFRGAAPIDDRLWLAAAELLQADPGFRGTLEQEELVRLVTTPDFPHAGESPLPAPLAHGPCPVDAYKACDVHVGVRLDAPGAPSLAWLGALQVASFAKQRADGEWRIFTATFSTLADGEQYLDIVLRHLPVRSGATAKAKIERLIACLRHPDDAPTLPLTSGPALTDWLERMPHAG